MTRLKKNGVCWEAHPAFAPLLDRVLAASSCTVKESPVASVTTCQVDETTFYVKRYRHGAVGLRPLKYLFKRSPARDEWELAQKLERLEIPTVRHLALGERWKNGGLQESILITEGFDGVPLDEAPHCDWAAVVALVNQMHERGVLQPDLHPANILVSSTATNLRLVDLHGILIKSSPLAAEDRKTNLAYLRIFLPIPVSDDIQQLSSELRRKHFAHRARRCLKHNREFAPKRLGGLHWQVRLPYLTETLKLIFADPDGFLATRAKILKPGYSSTVGCAEGIVLKRYNLRKAESVVKNLFRTSHARRAYLLAYHLELVGVSTARPIAVADLREKRVLLRSYLVMEEIGGATNLDKWQGNCSVAALRIAKLLAKLHSEGFVHRDLKAANIVLDTKERPHLLDLEGLRFIKHVPDKRATTDLARLARVKLPRVSLTHRVRFLKHYCEIRGQKDWRDWWKKISKYNETHG